MALMADAKGVWGEGGGGEGGKRTSKTEGKGMLGRRRKGGEEGDIRRRGEEGGGV